MSKRILVSISLGLLLLAGIASAQQDPQTASSRQLETRLFVVKNRPVEPLMNLLREIANNEAQVNADESSNQIIVQAPPAYMEEVSNLIRALDVAQPGTPEGQYFTCRVYMLELPAKDQNLKSFSLLLERSSQLPAEQVLDAARDANVQISTLLQRAEDDKWELILEGRSASNDALKQVLAKAADSQIKQLKWDDESFTAAIPAAQVSALPMQLQEHIHKFLGNAVQTAGYWFGNLSVPGDLNAPIGPWRLNMKIQPGQGADLVLEVRVTKESPIPFVNETQLFSNTVQSKTGRPIIIGYNRDSYGTRVMGAMVVLLEADTTEVKPQ